MTLSEGDSEENMLSSSRCIISSLRGREREKGKKERGKGGKGEGGESGQKRDEGDRAEGIEER